jgi:7-alpha-hydroxysteroid dehydrogenase
MSQARRVLVTGGSRGIGRAVALAFADAGHQVVVAARSTARQDESLVANERVLALSCDLSDLEAARALPSRAAQCLEGRPRS